MKLAIVVLAACGSIAPATPQQPEPPAAESLGPRTKPVLHKPTVVLIPMIDGRIDVETTTIARAILFAAQSELEHDEVHPLVPTHKTLDDALLLFTCRWPLDDHCVNAITRGNGATRMVTGVVHASADGDVEVELVLFDATTQHRWPWHGHVDPAHYTDEVRAAVRAVLALP